MKNILFNKGIGLDIIVFEDSILNDRVKLRDKIKKIQQLEAIEKARI